MKKVKSNTIQNGKGCKIRQGVNWNLYWNSDYWTCLDQRKQGEPEDNQKNKRLSVSTQ